MKLIQYILFMLLMLTIILTSGCSMAGKLTPATVPLTNLAQPGAEVSVLAGVGEYRNRSALKHQEIRMRAPVLTLDNGLQFDAVAKAHFSQNSSEPSLDFSEQFAGGGIGRDGWRFDWLANDSYYWLELGAQKELTDRLSIAGRWIHTSAHSLENSRNPNRRFKKTMAMVGTEYRFNKHWSGLLEYHAGNHGADEVHDYGLMGLKWSY